MTIFVDDHDEPIEPPQRAEEIDCRFADTSYLRSMLMLNLSVLGLTYAQIGKIFSVDKSRVCRHINKLTDEQKEDIRQRGFFRIGDD